MLLNDVDQRTLYGVPQPPDQSGALGGLFASQIGRMRYQLVIGFLIGVLLPSMVRPSLELYIDPIIQYDRSFLGTLAAFLLGFFIFRKVTAFPGVRPSGYILPSLAVSYVAVVLVFWVVRIEYSRYQFIASFVLTAATFYALFFAARRSKRLELAVIPGGEVERLTALRFVNWCVLASPRDASSSAPLVADLHADLGAEWERFIADSALAGRPVYHFKGVLESLSGRVQVEHLSENTFGSLLPNSIYASAKRYFEVILALVSLAQLIIPLTLVAIWIRLDSKGPALFRQVRMGFRGKPFTVYKFRTMRNGPVPAGDAPANDRKSLMTGEDDPRITRLGRFLRRTRIDELPQIINILKGEMSWIGPRPEALLLSRWYETQIPFYRYRHAVRPGITGWAQVNQGHVTSVGDADVKLQYDFFYVKNFSLWLDMLVVMRTVRVVFTGHGAK